jgi:hypothetical protein
MQWRFAGEELLLGKGLEVLEGAHMDLPGRHQAAAAGGRDLVREWLPCWVEADTVKLDTAPDILDTGRQEARMEAGTDRDVVVRLVEDKRSGDTFSLISTKAQKPGQHITYIGSLLVLIPAGILTIRILPLVVGARHG